MVIAGREKEGVVRSGGGTGGIAGVVKLPGEDGDEMVSGVNGVTVKIHLTFLVI